MQLQEPLSHPQNGRTTGRGSHDVLLLDFFGYGSIFLLPEAVIQTAERGIHEKRLNTFLFALMVPGLISVAHSALAQKEHIGTSTADTPSYTAKLTVENSTNSSISYRVKRRNGAWKTFSIVPGNIRSHWVPINDKGRSSTPYLSFDAVTDFRGHVTATKTYQLVAYKVGYNGYGAGTPYLTTPKRYTFNGSTTRSRTSIDLVSLN